MNIYGARKTLRSHGWCWLNIGDAGAFVRSIGNRHRCRFCWRVFVGFLINLVLDVYGVYYISNMMNWKLRFMIMWCLKYWWNHSFLSSFFLLAFHARVGGLFFGGGRKRAKIISIILLIYDMMYHQNYMECLTVVQVVKVDQASQDKCSCCC